MICPHCSIGIHEDWKSVGEPVKDVDGRWQVFEMECSECKRWIMRLQMTNGSVNYVFRPRNAARMVPADVPEPYSADFREASTVLADSAKASAALSRRCLQMLLRDKGGVKAGDLSSEIDEAMKALPSHLADSIDAIRNIGNFAAHPNKSTNTAEVIDVEPGEAEWCLDVLDGLFHFYFVQPAATQRRKSALNQKLQDANKPPMK